MRQENKCSLKVNLKCRLTSMEVNCNTEGARGNSMEYPLEGPGISTVGD